MSRKFQAGPVHLRLCLAVLTALALVFPMDALAATDATFGGISSDGTKAFFNSADQLTGDDTDGQIDVYQRSGTTTTRISVGAINGNLGQNASFAGASGDNVCTSTRPPFGPRPVRPATCVTNWKVRSAAR